MYALCRFQNHKNPVGRIDTLTMFLLLRGKTNTVCEAKKPYPRQLSDPGQTSNLDCLFQTAQKPFGQDVSEIDICAFEIFTQ